MIQAKEVIQLIKAEIATVAGLKYVDEDWGQLDYYSPNHPVKWPCVLMDVTGVNFSDIGFEKKREPEHRQMAEATLSLTVANLKLTNTSGNAPILQKENAHSIWDLINDLHKKLQGFRPGPLNGILIRSALRRVKRDDGVQEYNVTYKFGLTDV
jgi:hypothetical protein